MILIALRSINLSGKWIYPGKEFDLTDPDETKRLLSMNPPAAKFKMIIPPMNHKPLDQEKKPNEQQSSEGKMESEEGETGDTIDDNLDNTIDSEFDNPDLPVQTKPENSSTDHQGEVDHTGVKGEVVQCESGLKINGISNAICLTLEKSGFDSVKKIKSVKFEDLVGVPGLGYNNAKKVFGTVQKL